MLSLVQTDQTWFLHRCVLRVVARSLCWFWHLDRRVFHILGQDSKLGCSEILNVGSEFSATLLVQIVAGGAPWLIQVVCWSALEQGNKSTAAQRRHAHDS